MDDTEQRLFEAYRFLLKTRWDSMSQEERKQYIRRMTFTCYGCYDNADADLARVLENLGDDTFKWR